MRQFVHEGQLRPARQDRIQIHLGKFDSTMFQLAACNAGQPQSQGVGLFASVRFHVADDNIGSGRQFAARGLQHRVGLAYAGRHAQEDLEVGAVLTRLFILERA